MKYFIVIGVVGKYFAFFFALKGFINNMSKSFRVCIANLSRSFKMHLWSLVILVDNAPIDVPSVPAILQSGDIYKFHNTKWSLLLTHYD